MRGLSALQGIVADAALNSYGQANIRGGQRKSRQARLHKRRHVRGGRSRLDSAAEIAGEKGPGVSNNCL